MVFGPFLAAAWKLLQAIPLKTWGLIAFAIACAAALLYARHTWIEQGRAEYRQENKELRAELGKCAKVVRDQTKANLDAIKAAADAKADAEAAERRAGLYADKFAKQLVGIDKAITAAKRDPACKAILEKRTCVALQ